jgi:hypothetical protein
MQKQRVCDLFVALHCHAPWLQGVVLQTCFTTNNVAHTLLLHATGFSTRILAPAIMAAWQCNATALPKAAETLATINPRERDAAIGSARCMACMAVTRPTGIKPATTQRHRHLTMHMQRSINNCFPEYAAILCTLQCI